MNYEIGDIFEFNNNNCKSIVRISKYESDRLWITCIKSGGLLATGHDYFLEFVYLHMLRKIVTMPKYLNEI